MAASVTGLPPGPNITCPCNNTRISGYFTEEECLGFFCQSCWKEWLLERFVSATRDPIVTYQGKRYLSPIRSGLGESELSQVTASREELNPLNVADILKHGDQIMWHRPYILWHHAIVEDVTGTMLRVIHFSKSNGQIYIMRSILDATKEWGTLYHVTYNAHIRQYNPVELVIARARALIGIEGFRLFSNNCENFATFCKTGINTTHQSKWFKNKLAEIGKSIWQNAQSKAIATLLKVGTAELFELGAEEMKFVSRSTEAIGAGIIIAFEGGICVWNLGKLYQKYKNVPKDGSKSLSRRDFIKEMVDQVSQRFFAAGLGAGGGMALTALGTVMCPGIGLVGGAVLGIVGGCAGTALGHALGVTLGPFISHAIVKTIMTNDRAVTINELNPGDHIVLYKTVIHPRCHAIFIQNNKELRQLVVIRHSYKKGILLDTVSYCGCDPLFKVTYPKSRPTYSSNEILKRAIKAVAEYNPNKQNYNILWNNCKHFVYSITLKKE